MLPILLRYLVLLICGILLALVMPSAAFSLAPHFACAAIVIFLLAFAFKFRLVVSLACFLAGFAMTAHFGNLCFEEFATPYGRIWRSAPRDMVRLVRQRNREAMQPEFIAHIRSSLSRRMEIGIRDRPIIANINRAILFGERNALAQDYKQYFIMAGTAHVFAVSGLHVLFVMMFVKLLFPAQLPFRRKWIQDVLALLIVWFYVAIIGFRPSAIRAALMISFYTGFKLMRSPQSILVAWCWAALVIFMISPIQLFSISCLLSFAVMLGIALVLPRSPTIIERTELDWPAPPRTAFSRLLINFRNFMAVSIAAWLMSVPITAVVFGRLTLIGLFVNPFVIVLAGMMIPFAIAGVLFSFVSNTLAVVCNNFASFFTWLMIEISHYAAQIPFANFDVLPWSARACVTWYFCALLLFFIYRRECYRRASSSVHFAHSRRRLETIMTVLTGQAPSRATP